MVSRLRRPNADLSIELEDGPHRLGKAINGRVTLLPGESFQMRGGKVEFVCTETYWERVRRTTRMGSAETNESAATIIRQYSQPIFGDTEIANLMPQVGDIDFTLPLDAPPTVKGVVANIVWCLRATVDVARGRDISHELELVVLSATGERSGNDPKLSGDAAPAVSALLECDMNLSLAALRVCMGERVDGVFRIFPKEGLGPAAARMESIRIELMRLEKAGTSQADNPVGLLEFQKSEATTTAEAMEFPFSLSVPECLLATISVHETSVSWRVRATVSLSSGKELEISQRVTVRGSP